VSATTGARTALRKPRHSYNGISSRWVHRESGLPRADWIAPSLLAAAPQMTYLHLSKLPAQPAAMPTPQYQPRKLPWTNPALPLGKPLHHSNHKAWQQKTEQRRSTSRRHRQRSEIGHFRPNPCLEPSTLDRTRAPQHSKSCLKTPSIGVNNQAGCPPSRRRS